MQLTQAIKAGAWCIVGLNLLMALGSIGIFMRMAPAITIIIDQNETSLQACEEMLAALALSDNSDGNDEQMNNFTQAFTRAQNNLTESAEPVELQAIEQLFHSAFRGDHQARQATVNAIINVGKINRQAMVRADARAQQLGHAGAWGVVFMAVTVFMAGLVFVRNLTRKVVKPLEEIHAVIFAQKNEETMRRCVGIDLPQEIQTIFGGINGILDQVQTQTPPQNQVNFGHR